MDTAIYVSGYMHKSQTGGVSGLLIFKYVGSRAGGVRLARVLRLQEPIVIPWSAIDEKNYADRLRAVGQGVWMVF